MNVWTEIGQSLAKWFTGFIYVAGMTAAGYLIGWLMGNQWTVEMFVFFAYFVLLPYAFGYIFSIERKL
jgi:fatty acid desaturase